MWRRHMFRAVFNVDARTGCEAISISPKHKTVELRDVATGKITTESYDKLVLRPGAAPIRPPLPGIDLPGIFSVRTVPDARTIRQWLHRGEEVKSGMDSYTGFQVVTKPKRAVVVGGGFIGLEMVENLAHLGLEVTLIEKLDQVMPPLDPEMARLVERYLVKHGVSLQLADGVAGFRQSATGALEVLTESGKAYPADVVILAIGVRPETALAKAAGLEIGQRGGIRVDEHMCTSDPDILAVGDAVEVRDFVTGQWTLIPLAGPANRQGRIAADVIAGRDSRYRGTQGTSICKIFEGEIGQTGPSEKVLQQAGVTRLREGLHLPELARGLLPGRQDDGDQGALPQDRRAPARRAGALRGRCRQAGRRLCNGDPDGRDRPRPRGGRAVLRAALRQREGPRQLRGNGRGNLLRGDMPIVHWDGTGQGFLLDVRNPPELEVESVPGALNIPLPQLRARLGELPRDQEIQVICRSAVRAYYATRILVQNGFNARNISGGMLARSHRA